MDGRKLTVEQTEKFGPWHIYRNRAKDRVWVGQVTTRKLAALITQAGALKRDNARMAEMLTFAAAWFRDYERQHRAKGTEDGALKADTNAERASACEQTISSLEVREDG